MNLHISHDNVFMDYIIPIVREVDPGNNKFVFFSYDKSPHLKFIKSDEVNYCEYGSEMFKTIIGNISDYKSIFVHWLEGLTADFVNKVPDGVNVVWCFWGGDGLEIPKLRESIYQPKSLQYFRNNSNKRIRGIRDFKKLYIDRRKNVQHLNAIRRVNYFAHYLEDDFIKITKATGMQAQFVPFHYAAVEDIVPMKESPKSDGCDILLGNSDTLSNNHFEAIDKLSELDLKDSKVYCPLSYEKGKYAADVAAYGKKKLGNRFVALTEFMKKDKYDEMLSGINTAIMNHNRSQALGNIMVLIWKGSKLYMNNTNPIYKLFSDNGAFVFDLDKLTSEELAAKLDESSISKNREVLMKLFSKANQKEKIKKMLAL